MGDFLCTARCRSRGEQGPVIDDALLHGPKWCEYALLNDASLPIGKRLFRNDPLATGHPLARIRVFNSASEGNEEKSDRARRRHLGMRMEEIAFSSTVLL